VIASFYVVATKTPDTFCRVGPIDAIIIHQDHLQYGCDVVAKLRRVTPGTPVILLFNRDQRTEMKPTGISAVCTLDLGDEELVRSMWVFLRLIWGRKQDMSFGSSMAHAV
jgi:hypothetical protein